MVKGGILIKPNRPGREHDHTVHFLDMVYQLQLPEEESHPAWLARFGLWKPAPYHDELWDGDLMQFRERPLTKAELAKENKNYWLRQHFPVSIYIYSWIGKKRKKPEKVKPAVGPNDYVIEAEEVEAELTEKRGAAAPMRPKIKTRDAAKRGTMTFNPEELNKEIDRMISDEPKKPKHLLNRELVERKTMLVQEYLRENGRAATPEEVERELQRRVLSTQPELIGKKGKESTRKEEVVAQRLEDLDDESGVIVVPETRGSSARASAMLSRGSGSGFGWELLDRLYGVFGDDEKLTGVERDLDEVERYDAVNEEMNRIDGVRTTPVQRIDFYETTRAAVVEWYENLQKAIRLILNLDEIGEE